MVIKYNLAYIVAAGTDCQANEKLPRQSRLTSSRVLWKSGPQLLFCRWHSISFFFSSLYFLLSSSPAFTCRVAAAVSEGGIKLIESIEAKRKLTTTGWLVLLFCLERNATPSLLEKVREYFPNLSLNCFVFLYMHCFPTEAISVSDGWCFF